MPYSAGSLPLQEEQAAMTTNQTIDGVPRELLEYLVAYVADSPNAIMRARSKELRALLDAKPDGTLTDEGTMPAAQPQGEPVAWRYREGEGTQWRLTDMPPSTWYFDPRQYEVRNLYDRPAQAPVAVLPIQEDRGGLIAYGRSCGLDEASTLCSRLAYDTYYPAGSRFKHFIPKALEQQGNLLIKAANAIASLPGGPYDRFKVRQAKKAESAKSQKSTSVLHPQNL
jgi:hypothetical protein